MHIIDEGLWTSLGGCGGRMEAAPMGGKVGKVVMERLYEGRRLKTLGDGEGERRIRWAASGGTLWRRQRWGGSGAEGRDGRLGLGGATVRRASIPGGWRWQ